jgi:hypothetical protein
MKDFDEIITQSIAEVFKSKNILHNNGDYSKLIDNIWIRKPSVQTKDYGRKWLDEVLPEEIDNRYYNLNDIK